RGGVCPAAAGWRRAGRPSPARRTSANRAGPDGAPDRDRQANAPSDAPPDRRHAGLPRSRRPHARRRRRIDRDAAARDRHSVADRLRATREWARGALDDPAGSTPLSGAPYAAADDFAAPLRLCYRSLVDTGNRIIAAGGLTDVLRRVSAFGLTLARLDLRQES